MSYLYNPNRNLNAFILNIQLILILFSRRYSVIYYNILVDFVNIKNQSIV